MSFREPLMQYSAQLWQIWNVKMLLIPIVWSVLSMYMAMPFISREDWSHIISEFPIRVCSAWLVYYILVRMRYALWLSCLFYNYTERETLIQNFHIFFTWVFRYGRISFHYIGYIISIFFKKKFVKVRIHDFRTRRCFWLQVS